MAEDAPRELRISDRAVYDTQMRQLIGLEPKPESARLIL